jgi:sulfate adenylyltransferase subunit 2
MSGKKLSSLELNRLRKIAVELRLSGETLAVIKQKTGLSNPTIISAHKRFIKGSWVAVNTGRRGRPKALRLGPGSQNDCLRFMFSNLSGNSLWSTSKVQQWFRGHHHELSSKTINRYLKNWGITVPPAPIKLRSAKEWLRQHHPGIDKGTIEKALKCKVLKGGIAPLLSTVSISAAQKDAPLSGYFVYAQDFRGKLYWLAAASSPDSQDILRFLDLLDKQMKTEVVLSFHSAPLKKYANIQQWLASQSRITLLTYASSLHDTQSDSLPQNGENESTQSCERTTMALTHLQRLEAESIQIMREVASKADNPVMLYSIGKDSAVMLHLAMKAFHPSKPPFPLMHIDTGWKFREMYTFRDDLVKNLGVELITYKNPEGVEKNINPFTHGSALHTHIMKTEGLKQALNKFKFDVAFGGARRDEEKSRAKERIFSFRTTDHRWDPKNQRPELWKNYNANKRPGESIRAFPISNWTELDIWQYIYLEQIPIVPLYLSAERPVVERDGSLIMVDDERMPLLPNEVPMMKSIRFRTLGCYPLTGAVESKANTLPAVIQEMLLTKTSERQGRMIDHDSAASMEKKKQEGYF